MDIKYGKGLVFEPDDDQQENGSSPLAGKKEEALRQIIRHGFRTPVDLSQQMTLTIAGDSYAVFNLSPNGVGVYLKGMEQFEENTRLLGMVLAIGGQSFTVEGTVVHLARDGVHNLCGIGLTSMTPECRKAIVDYLRESRNTLFAP